MECGQCALSGQFDQTSLVNVYHHDHYQYLVKNAASDQKKWKDTVKEKQNKTTPPTPPPRKLAHFINMFASILESGMKLLIHSQTPTVQPLKFGKG